MGSTTFDVETVSNVILNLKKGKVSGLDNVTLEHLQYCHPRVIVIISILFKLFRILGFIPDSFGCGCVIPIQK